MCCKPVDLIIILLTMFLSEITSLKVVTRYQHLDLAILKTETRQNDDIGRIDIINISGMSDRSTRGRTYTYIHDGGKWIYKRMRSISELLYWYRYRRIPSAYSTTCFIQNHVTDIFCQTSQSWCVGTSRTRTVSGRHLDTHTSTHRKHVSVQQIL